MSVTTKTKKVSDGLQATVQPVKGNVRDITVELPHQPSVKAIWAGAQKQERMENTKRADDAPG